MRWRTGSGSTASRCGGAISSRPSQMPYTIAFDEPGVEELEIDSGDYAALLDKALAAFGWQALQQDLAAPPRAGRGGRGRGRDLPRRERARPDRQCQDRGRRHRRGRADHRRRLARPGLRDRHGADLRRGARRRLSARARHPRPDRPHRSRHRRACGARHRADRRRRARHRRHGAREGAWSSPPSCLQTPAAELDIVDGTVRRRDRKGGPSITLAEIARRIAPGSKLLRGREPQLAAHGWYNTDHTVFPYGVHLAAVRIDRETGQVAVERFMVAYDVGRAVNPLLIEGQLVGGCVQGLGGALSRGISLRPERRAAGGDVRGLPACRRCARPPTSRCC